MAKRPGRNVRLRAAIEKIEGALTEIEALKEEMEEWAANLEGTNLQYTQKYEDVCLCAATMEGAWDEIENVREGLEDLEFPRAFGPAKGV